MNLLFTITLFTFLIFRHLFFWRNRISRPLSNKPLYIAHRGYRINSPDNSISAINSAIENGFSWVEVDVVSTNDKVLYCNHDFDLEETTDGLGYIYDYSSMKINMLSYRDRKTNTYSERIAKLSTVLEMFNKRINFNIEIKSKGIFDISGARAVSKLINKYDTNSFIISSFNPIVILYFRLFNRKIPTGLIIDSKVSYFLIHLLHPQFIHPSIKILNNQMFIDSETHNFGINVWTLDNPIINQWLIKENIDGIITDIKC